MVGQRNHAYVVVYDIADPRRLKRVHRACLRFGEPLQESVFLCRLTPDELYRLQSALYRVIHVGEDSVRYYPLCDHDLRRGIAMGQQASLTTIPASWVV